MLDNGLVCRHHSKIRLGRSLSTAYTFLNTNGNTRLTCKTYRLFFMRYSAAPTLPARAAPELSQGVTLREPPFCAFRFAFHFAFFLAFFLDNVITANGSFQYSALVSRTHPAHPITSFRRAWSAYLAPLFLFAFFCHRQSLSKEPVGASLLLRRAPHLAPVLEVI